MPAQSKSQQRLFGMVHAYNKGEFHGSRSLRKRIAELVGHISDEDARHFAETPHEGLPEKKAVDLSDGSAEDVGKVMSTLSDLDMEYLTGRSGCPYRPGIPRLAGRTVAYDGGSPVGFCDAWGQGDDGRLSKSVNMAVAVSPDYRGKGLAGELSKETLDKVLNRASQERRSRLRKIVWELCKDNAASARTAESLGLKEKIPYSVVGQRCFVLPVKQAEAYVPGYNRVRAQYARDPEGALERLAARLAARKWGREDVLREMKSHLDEFAETDEDKNLIDAAIIARIGQQHADSAEAAELARQALDFRSRWEARNPGRLYVESLPGRLARFRQYADIPFPSN